MMKTSVTGDAVHYMRKLGKLDAVLFGAVILLNLMGLVSINSISEIVGIDGILFKQTAGSILGLIIMTVLSTVNYKGLEKYYKILYGIVIIALAAVLVFGTSGGGARRWIGIGGITFQPSELAKILLILFYSEFIINYMGTISRWKVFALSTLLILPPVLMILKEPDLSTGIMVFLIFCVILFAAGISGKVIAGVFAAAVPSFLILLFLVLSGDSTFLGEYQTRRILAWIHPEDYANSTAYQTMNSMTAIGSGRLIGKGLSTGTSGTLLGTGFISESQTDFIFAVIGEQFGLDRRLRNGGLDRSSELPEHRGGDRSSAKYRNTASIRQLRPDQPDLSVWRTWICSKYLYSQQNGITGPQTTYINGEIYEDCINCT